MKLNTWLTSGFSARGDHSDSANWLVWFPAQIDTLTAGPLKGDSESVPFFLTPKTSAVAAGGEDIVLLGVPLGDLDRAQGNWRFNDRSGAGTDVVQLRGQFPIEQVQVVAGQNRAATKRAIEVLRGVESDFDGERQFHTMPELFPDEA